VRCKRGQRAELPKKHDRKRAPLFQ
jgi:hypothetical protein